MPRFFFHVRDAAGLTRDPDGGEFPDLAAAIADARAAVREILSDALRSGAAVDGRRFEIHEGAGGVLATIPFRDALGTAGPEMQL